MNGDYPANLLLLVDRVKVSGPLDDDLRTRLHSSLQAAFDMGGGDMYLWERPEEGAFPGANNKADAPGNAPSSGLTHFCSRF